MNYSKLGGFKVIYYLTVLEPKSRSKAVSGLHTSRGHLYYTFKVSSLKSLFPDFQLCHRFLCNCTE